LLLGLAGKLHAKKKAAGKGCISGPAYSADAPYGQYRHFRRLEK
jgi:hypothetical protein